MKMLLILLGLIATLLILGLLTSSTIRNPDIESYPDPIPFFGDKN